MHFACWFDMELPHCESSSFVCTISHVLGKDLVFVDTEMVDCSKLIGCLLLAALIKACNNDTSLKMRACITTPYAIHKIVHMWQAQVENEHYSTLNVLI